MENKDISITLTVQQWNIVMNAVVQRPFVEVAEIFSEMKKQAEAQVSAPSDAPAAG